MIRDEQRVSLETQAWCSIKHTDGDVNESLREEGGF